MEDDELVLSDVHIDLKSCNQIACAESLKYPAFVTRFIFNQQEDYAQHHSSRSTELTESSTFRYDDDGDIILERKPIRKQFAVNIEHTMSTQLKDVGLQVWQGCLYLCDYIIDNHQEFHNSTVVELGAGVGLASIIASIFARKVICTDIGNEVLKVCQRNTEINKCLTVNEFDDAHCESKTIVRELDWTKTELNKDVKQFSWTCDDEYDLYSSNIIIAADVIYHDSLTDAFFQTVRRIMSRTLADKKQLLISVEKRLNFTLEHLDVACPAYVHFRKCLDDLCNFTNSNGLTFTAKKVDDIPQFCLFSRSKQLVSKVF